MMPDWIKGIYEKMLCSGMYGDAKIKYFEKTEAFELRIPIGHRKYYINLYRNNECVGTKYLDTLGANVCFLAWGNNWDDDGRVVKSSVGDIFEGV